MRLVSSLTAIVVTLLSLVLPANGQLCQGSLGDPLANVTFGSGSNPGQPLTSATTSYSFTSMPCPGDGVYTVVNSTSGCHGNTWHTISRDHTGNTDGYFMLVNASLQPSAFYVDTVRGLCANTTFEFAAWVCNVLLPSACGGNGILPNLTFTIERTDGTVLQTYQSGNILPQGSPTWQQFGYFFTMPSGTTDVVLRIVNNSQGGCGNDLALDDITFRPCGPDIIAAINGIPGMDVAYCEGPAQSYLLNGTLLAGYNNPSLQWQENVNGAGWIDIPGENGFTLQRDYPAGAVPASYLYRLSAAEVGNMAAPYCRTASKVLSVTINPNPVTTAKSNSPVCEGGLLTLTATGGTQYAWTGVSGFTGNGAVVNINNVQLTQAGKYYVTVTSAANCTHNDSVTTVVNPSPTAVVASASENICLGDNVPLNASGGNSYEWMPADGLSSASIADPVASPVDTVLYQVIVSNGFACSDTTDVTVNVASLPFVDAGPNKAILEGDVVTLEGSGSGQDVDYVWTPMTSMNSGDVLRPEVSPPVTTIYTLTGTSTLGCGEAFDQMQVTVYKDIFVPNAFSPNNDGVNEVWRVPALAAVKSVDLRVYNRYGQMIFQTSDGAKGWDGKFNGIDQPVGTYVYMLRVDEGKRLLKGTITLVR